MNRDVDRSRRDTDWVSLNEMAGSMRLHSRMLLDSRMLLNIRGDADCGGRRRIRGDNDMSVRVLLLRCCLTWLILLVGGSANTSRADEVDFQREVEPIFASHCAKCHGPKRQRSGLRLDSRNSLLRGGDQNEPTIVPGEPQNSLLMRVVSQPDSDLRMPPEGPRLTKDQISVLRRWIKQGAAWPGQMDEGSDLVVDHWSFHPVSPTPVPQSIDDSPTLQSASDSIDRFVIEKLSESGLAMSQPAEAITLLRRVSFVLTGLPPTPEHVGLFLTDPEGVESAYRRAVDRLLDSPRYGERWAQHWLDVIRWAETVGFETNGERKHAWPYRDWVIQSLNDDKPYDEFVFQQLAGDTCGEDVGLGFLVAGPANLPGSTLR